MPEKGTRGLWLLILKEVKDMVRDPKILIGMVLFPALMLPLMGSAISISTGSTIENAYGNLTVYVMDEDGGAGAEAFVDFVTKSSIMVVPVSGDPASVAESLDPGSALILIPEGFTQNITESRPSQLVQYTNLKEYSLVEFLKANRVTSLVGAFETMVVKGNIGKGMPGADPNVVLNPINLTYQSIIKGEAQPINPSVLQSVIQLQGFLGPLVIMVVLILAMQVAATSIAVEKEAKTLETLLTIPVSRMSILFSKLAGTVAIALLATVANVFAFTYYFSSLLGATTVAEGTVDLASMGLTPSMLGYVILGLALFGSLITALALALTLGTLAKDVRGAQSLIGILMLPVILPTFLLMMGDINSLPPMIQTVLYLIPFTYTTLASQALFTGNYTPILIGLVYIAAFVAITLYVAAKVFSTERIMTARLSFWKGKAKAEG
jgi:ABC-2 type transport system permease protein